MFRVVSEFVEQPFYMMLCDDPRCSVAFHHPLPEEVTGNPEGEALKAAHAMGWIVSVGRQLCPGHANQLRAIDENMREKNRERGLIVVPRRPIVSAHP